jgi:hypothetical protein
MFVRSHKLRGLITAAAAAVAAAAFAIPASADSGPCTPPAGADGWYCAALSTNNAVTAKRVTDRLVDDYFRDAVALSAPTSEGIVDDSWRSPVMIEGAQQTSGGFNWGDFGIGIAVAVGAMFAVLGVTNRVKGQRRLGIGRA